jgi:hypothetical protein
MGCMRRLGWVALASLLGAPAALASASLPPSGFVVTGQRTVHPGVEYATVARSGPAPAVAHVAHIAPDATVDLRLVSAQDRAGHGDGDRELTSSMCARAGCVVGVNAGFWDAGVTSEPPRGRPRWWGATDIRFPSTPSTAPSTTGSS